MNRSIALFLIGLVFGGGIGFTVAAGSGASLEGHDHSDASQHGTSAGHSMMDHSAHAQTHDTPLEVPTAGAPEVSIMVMPDPMAGYNLHVMTQNFVFSPQNASGDHVDGEGHAHFYINGEKLGRLYSNWYHLDALPKGEVAIKVTLNANNHSPFAVQGTPIMASQTLTIE